MWKNGQAKSLEEYTETAVRQMCLKWYRKGFRDGKREAEKKLNPDVHYCRECKWLCGDVSSIGIRCMNVKRKRAVHVHSCADYKTPSTKACKSGFESKEDSENG